MTTQNCIHNTAMDVVFPSENESSDDHFTEPNSNVEALIEMTAMEYMHFTSDVLEYNPNDWAPISNFNTDTLSTIQGAALVETSLLLIDAMCDEAPPNDARPCSPMLPFCRLDARDFFASIVWYNDMPTAHPVSQDEYYEYINHYGLGFTMIQNIEEGPNVRLHQSTVDVLEKKALSTSRTLPKKTKVAAAKIPHRKTQSLKGKSSINLKMKRSTSHSLPKKKKVITEHVTSFVVNEPNEQPNTKKVTTELVPSFVENEKKKLSTIHILPKKTNVTAEKIPYSKTRSIGGKSSVNITIKRSTSHTLPKKKKGITVSGPSFVVNEPNKKKVATKPVLSFAVNEEKKLSTIRTLPTKTKVAAQKIPQIKTRSIGENASINLKMKGSTSHSLTTQKQATIAHVPYRKTRTIGGNCSINIKMKRVDVSVHSKPQKPRKPLNIIMNRNKATKRAT